MTGQCYFHGVNPRSQSGAVHHSEAPTLGLRSLRFRRVARPVQFIAINTPLTKVHRSFRGPRQDPAQPLGMAALASKDLYGREVLFNRIARRSTGSSCPHAPISPPQLSRTKEQSDGCQIFEPPHGNDCGIPLSVRSLCPLTRLDAG